MQIMSSGTRKTIQSIDKFLFKYHLWRFIIHILRSTLHNIRLWHRGFFRLSSSNSRALFPEIVLSPESAGLSPNQMDDWRQNGYLILPGFFSFVEIESVNSEVDCFWQSSRHNLSELTVDIFLDERGQRVKLHDAPIEARSRPYKLNDIFLSSSVVRDLILENRLRKILNVLLGGEPLVCNTLNLEFGSQQDFHTDSLYMTPPKDLNLIATWIALEDCFSEAGPLQYYPGSHKIPPYVFSSGQITSIDSEMDEYRNYMNAEIKRRALVSNSFCAKKGDLFIWHSQLFHGGSKILNPTLTRKSIVTHYFKRVDLSCEVAVSEAGGFYMMRQHQSTMH